MGQNRRPNSGSQQQIHRGPNGIIAPPADKAGMDMAALPGNGAVSLKLEAVKKMVQRKSDTPPPHDRQPSPADSKGEGVRGASEGWEGTPQETEAQRRKREEVLLANAAAVRAVRATLSLAYQRPHPEPAAAPTNGDYVLQEMRWLATDFGQERLWKRTAARAFAHAAAAAARKGGLKPTPLGDAMRAEAARASAQEDSVKSRKERMASNRNAGTSGAPNGVLHAPASLSDLMLTYKAGADLPELLERHIIELAEAEVIMRLQEEREWEEEVDAARRLAAELAEQKRQEKEAAEDAADGATTVDEEDQPLGLKNKRRKKGRLAPHILEDYVELDDVADVGTPLGRRLGGPSRRPTSSLRPSSGLSDRQLSDAEQRVRKRRRRDLDDEDYEEPIQPRRVSARKASQVAASMDRQRGGLMRQPDKRGAAAGQANKKTLNRMDSMGYGIGRRASGAAVGGQTIPWTSEEERLLCAIVHEFGSNWYLVADVLAASCSMQGIYRSPYNCRQKFRAITMSGQGDAESTEESALAAMQIDKMSARQLLHQSLPVPTDVLGAHQRALANVGQKARQNRQQDDIRARSAAMQRVDAHPSYQLVVAGVLATSGGAHHTPMELAEAAETAATNAAQAVQQVANIAPPPGAPMAPGLAGPPMAGAMSPAQAFPPAMPPMQPPPLGAGFAGPGQPPPSPGGAAAAGPAGPPPATGADQMQQQMPPGMPGMPPVLPPGSQQQPLQQLPAAAQPPNGAAPPMSVPMVGSPAQVASPGPMQQQPLATGVPGSPAGVPYGMPMAPGPGTPGGTPQQPQQQQQQQQRGQISQAQLQQILRSNQLPDGRELTPPMRAVLIQRIQGQQQRQPQPRAGMPPGMQPPQAMQMQAAQNLVAQQQAAAARMQQTMQQGQQPMQQQPGQQPGGIPGQQLPPGMLPNGLPGMRPPGGYGLPVGAPLGGSAPPAMMAAGQPRPPAQGGLPPMAPGQMIAGGMAPPQMPGPNMGAMTNLLAQPAAAAKPPGTSG
ncbi:hypothetical protein WJX75_005313 [Coccomyxa subellipsoidea]|uniref:Myb-like domain-containing protein n=1 Tax=Coccomyxa subellipsoidea TaxID=248742 RepID=A0ABR2YI18_9CHLO